MFQYYTAIIALSWMALGVLAVLISNNGRISATNKRHCYFACALIAVSALMEWLGVLLDGNAALPAWPLQMVKCLDYILTPATGAALLALMDIRGWKQKALYGLLSFNAVFQVIGSFFGWVFIIDESCHYTHGPLYPAYMGLSLTVIALVILCFVSYAASFRRRNSASLYAIMVLVVAGIIMQEVLDRDIRTDYLALTMGITLLFIHYMEFSQLAADEHMREQRILITTDALTGVLSRYAYHEALLSYTSPKNMPPDFAVFSIDLNNLKPTNDRLGHAAGDELICGAARVVEAVFGEKSRCFRTGGDEYVVFTSASREEADEQLRRLKQQSAAWSGTMVRELSFSAGYALSADHPDLSAEDLVRQADTAMYAAKAEYYRSTGHDRRRGPR